MYFIAADKHGWEVKKVVELFLASQGIFFENLGVTSESQDMKLEDFIPLVAKKVLENPSVNRGILICGTGIGVNIGANRFSGIRSHLAISEEQARWSRQYDNCNVLCLVGWNADKQTAEKILKAWLETDYDGDEERRSMFNAFDAWH